MEKQMCLFGKECNVKSRISYAEKLEAAERLASLKTVFDEERGIAYIGYMADAARMFIELSYYTDLDMTEYDSYDGMIKLMDMVEQEDQIEQFEAFVVHDFCTLTSLADIIFCNAREIFEKEHSLGYRIEKSFGFLLDGQDVAQTLAQARDVNEQMIDHLGIIMNAKQEKPIDLSQYAKKNK